MGTKLDRGSYLIRYLALGVLSGASIFGLTRNFTQDRAVVRIVIAAWLALALGAAASRVGWGIQARLLLVTFAGVWFIAAVYAPDALVAGLPLRVGKLWEAWTEAGKRIGDAVSPVEPIPAFMLASSWYAWVGATVSDLGASLGRRVVATVPWVTLFGFTSATGDGRGARSSFLLFTSAVIAYLFLLEVEAYSGRKGQRAQSAARLVPSASFFGVISIVAGLLLPGFVPGYGRGAVVNWGFGPSSQTTISPLVQIRPRLTAAQEVSLFSVRVDRLPPEGAALYWRLVALDRFDGKAWQSSAEYRPASGRIRSVERVGGVPVRISQSYRLSNLGGLWIPAAYQAVRIDDVAADWDPKGSALTVRGGVEKGETYRITSTLPAPSASQLLFAPIPASLSGYRGLQGVSPEVRALAEQLTKNAPTPYEKVLAITEHLRRFRYDERVKPGHSTDELMQFLTRTKAGYCEQFAGSMAVLLRAIGLPSRVAVGFLRGNYNPATRTFGVTTEHAHAWPEVYFEGHGWVPFEPTPRDIAVPPLYAVRPQAVSGEAGPSEVAEESPPPPPSPVPTATEDPLLREAAGSPREKRNPLSVGLVAAGVALQLIVLLGGAKEYRTRRRYRLAHSPQDRVRAAFSDFEERVADLFRRRRRSETAKEFCQEVVVNLDLDAGRVGSLLAAFEKVVYGRQPAEVLTDGEEAHRIASRLRKDCWEKAGWRGRVALLVSPKSLIPLRS